MSITITEVVSLASDAIFRPPPPLQLTSGMVTGGGGGATLVLLFTVRENNCIHEERIWRIITKKGWLSKMFTFIFIFSWISNIFTIRKIR